MFIEENVNPCERNEEDIQGDVALCRKGRMSYKAVRQHARKASGRAVVHLNSFLTSALNRNP